MPPNTKLRITSQLNELDWKVQRHIEQRELVAAGQLSATKLTEVEYLAVLAEKQRLRELEI